MISSDSKNKEKISQDNNSTENNSLCVSKKDFHAENMIKGRIAETLIEELFLQLGFPYSGMGWKIQSLA